MITDSGTDRNVATTNTPHAGQSSNVVDLSEFRGRANQAILDDIGGRAFMFLRDQANANDIPMKSMLADHLVGIANVLKSVEGSEMAVGILDQVKDLISDERKQANGAS